MILSKEKKISKMKQLNSNKKCKISCKNKLIAFTKRAKVEAIQNLLILQNKLKLKKQLYKMNLTC